MRRAPLLVAAWVAAAYAPARGAPVAAAGEGYGFAGGAAGGLAAADTILVRDLSAPRPTDLPDSLAHLPALRLGLQRRALLWPQLPTRPPGADDLVLRAGEETLADRWLPRLARHADPDEQLRRSLASRAERLGRPADELAFLPPLPRRAPPPEPAPDTSAAERMPGFVSDIADLGVRVSTRMEIGGDWVRFRPCEDLFQESCDPDLLPQLSPDLRFDVQVGGSIAERVHVDVDFDQMREFEAANTINVFYQGGEDEIVQRLEVGDVTFRLPTSRFVTEGIPAGNFGFRADGQLGPMDFQAVWAEQRGDVSSRVFRLSGVGNQRAFVQEDTLVLDDADYVKGQFFFLVDPREIDDYPHVDVLALDGAAVPASVAPGFEPVQLYRFENDPAARQQVEGLIQADAVATLGADTVVESGWFRYLQPGVDYFVHPSGLWAAVRNPLREDEMLAATYVTAAGDTIGDYNPEQLYNAGLRPTLRLLKASRAGHQPGRPTWEQEMHQVYRVSGSSDVETASVDVTISLGELSAGRTFKRGPDGRDLTFLRLLGLDQESPTDEIDPAFVYTPARDLFQDQPPVRGTFVVFPTLEPFHRPPPLPSLGLDEDDTRLVLGDDANDRIYEAGDPFERDNGGLFRITIPFRTRSEDVITAFSLGALGIRDGSERIYLGERLLVRGLDYEIDYDVGQVALLDPEALFATSPDPEIRATWEQKQLFRVAPVSVFGLNTRWGFGQAGSLDLVGLFQSQKSLVNRPTLGLEPGSIGLGGASLRLRDDVEWLDRLLDAVPGLRLSGASSVALDGEMAVSLPDPNTRGAVFLDDFDASDARPLSLLSFDWIRGSAPTFRDGAEQALPLALDATDLAGLVWQHQWILTDARGDSVGIFEGLLPTQEIDRQIRVAGSQVRDPALLLTFGEAPFAERRWASITSTLSTTGVDLTRSEFIEFYASGGDATTLVLDLGTVSEDALFVGADGRVNGTKASTGAPWGLGVLDQEADPARGEIWGDAADRRGVWDEVCVAERGRIYRVGDPDAVCTRGNGRQDSEDTDGDGNLDTTEKHLRFVVRLDGSSPYLARTRAETGTDYRLYRIPLESLLRTEVGGAFTEADRRAVRHLRITATADRRQSVTLTRLRIVGSRWIKRSQDGVLRGIGGDTLAGAGRVEVSPVSRVTEGDAYTPPPGVLEQLSDPTSAIGAQGVEFNEKSLSIRVDGVGPGDRAEVYDRFPQRPRNFLQYREGRFWAVARSGDFGMAERSFLFFKVGTDAENFYLRRARLDAPPGGGLVGAADWQEVVVDFDRWLDLRRRAEEVLILDPPGPGGPPVTVWSADSAYAVVLKDRGRAPDLANVRELSLGVWNDGGGGPVSGEVWIDELRLTRAVTDAGMAGFLNLEVAGGDVWQARASYQTRSALFRQLEERPSYLTDRVLSLATRFQLDHFAPADWGVEVPVTVNHDQTDQDPTFLANSDVRADRLNALRPTGARQTRVGVGFRKSTPSANPLLSVLLDGLEAGFSWFDAEASTVTSRQEAQGIDANLGYRRELPVRDFGLVPGPLEPLVRFLLPRVLEEGLLGTRFRWSPERFSVGTSYLRHDSRVFRYDRIIELPGDSAVRPTPAPRETLEGAAELRLRPFPSLLGDVTLLSTRDVLPAVEAVRDPEVRALIQDARGRFAGVDFGWETNRVLRTRVAWRPSVVPWLTHGVDVQTSYAGDRNANFVEARPVSDGLDTVLVLTRSANGERSTRADVGLDPGGMMADLVGGPDGTGGGVARAVVSAVRPVRFAWQSGLNSRFNREPVDPGARYQLGLGGVDDFRFLSGDTAATLTDRTNRRWSSGLSLPGGIGVDVAYEVGDVATLDTRSDRTVETRTWPDVQARIERLPVPRFLAPVVDRFSLTAGYQRAVREVAFGGEGLQRRMEADRQLPVEVTVGWGGTTTTTYTGRFRDGEGTDPTGDTDRDRENHQLTVTSRFQPPFFAPGPRPFQLSLGVSYIEERECRRAVGRADCVAFVDQINRGANLTLGTELRGFEVGLQASWNDRQSFVGLNTGSTQFQVGVFGQMVFEAGVLPGAAFR